MATAVSHPYSPVTLELPGFVPQSLSREFILGVFTACTVVVVGGAWSFSGRYKYLSTLERVLTCWWLFTGLTHVVVEGYFVFTPDFYKLPYTNFFAELWKEYGKGDSRYPGRDLTIVLLEAITSVIEGPAALLAVHAILYRKPYEHVLQLSVSLGQLYGDILYFASTFYLKEEFSAPGPIYFWGYFVFMNMIWIVVPSLICIRSWRKICDSEPTSFPEAKKTDEGGSGYRLSRQ